MKIFLDGLSKNPTVSIGTQGLILSSIQIIKKYISNAQILLLSAYPKMEQYYCSSLYPETIIIKRDLSKSSLNNYHSVIKEVDAVVSTWGDGYITTPPKNIFWKTLFIKSREKPTVLFPSSIGPFCGKLEKYLVKKGLKRFDRIMVRDTITYKYFTEIGIKNIMLFPDPAVIIQPARQSRIHEIFCQEGVPDTTKLIGLNISQLLNSLYKEKKKEDYTKFMADLATYLYKTFNRHVLLIPHQIAPKDITEKSKYFQRDDRFVIEQTYRNMKNKEIATPILGEYNIQEYKGMISQCDLFVGGRMHSIIGALSCNVPSIAIQYSHKAPGMLEIFGFQKYVWHYDSAKEILFDLINNAWESRELLKNDLKNHMGKVKKDAWKPGEILVNVLKEYNLPI